MRKSGSETRKKHSPARRASASKAGRGVSDPEDLVSARIEDWRRRLIDLSHRNRLIAFKATAATTLTIAAPSLDELLAEDRRGEPWDFYFPPDQDLQLDDDATSTASTLDQLVIDSQATHRGRLPREIEVTEKNPKRIARILDNLAKRANNEYQDKALRILYLAAGFLDWYDAAGERDVTSPLVLVPVELRRETTRDPYRLFFVEDEDIVINPSLTEKLRRDAGMTVPSDWAWEEKPIAEELDEIRVAVSHTSWKVRDAAVIGLFSFQKYVMYRDLLDNEDRVASHPVVRSLALGTLQPELRERDPDIPDLSELDEEQPPADSLSILDSDASQRQCIEAAVRGRSFVMQGPPGTGKSQTIANIIAECIGRGKRILFVSEKAAALDVVHKRLAAKGLDEYCLLLHGEHAGRREVVQALDRSLTTTLRPGGLMRGDELERLANLRTLLNTSAETLHLPQPLLGGRTVREVHEELAVLHGAPSSPGAPKASASRGRATLSEYEGLAEIFQRLAERWHVSSRDYVWRGYAADTFTADEHGRVASALRRLRDAITALAAHSARVAASAGLEAPSGPSGTAEIAELGGHIRSAPRFVETDWLERPASEFRRAAHAAHTAFERLASATARVRELYPSEVWDRDPALPEALDAARRRVEDTCGRTEALTSRLTDLPKALDAMEALSGLVERVRTTAQTAAGFCGQPAAHLTATRLVRIADLAELAFAAQHRPERTWLVRAGADRAEACINSIAGDLETYQLELQSLQTAYTDGFLELDAEPMADRFEQRYTSVFSKLSGSYRRDAKALKAVRRDGSLPAEPVTELRRIAHLQAQGARIDAWAASEGTILGSYAAGRETSVSEVRAALATARRVIELSDPDADLDGLVRTLCAGSSPDPAAARAAEQLRDAGRAFHQRLQTFDEFVAGEKIGEDETLEDVTRRLESQGAALHALAEVARSLDAGAPARATSLETLVERAGVLGDARAAHDAIRAGAPEWARMLGQVFRGHESDWQEMDSIGRWLERFESFGDMARTPQVRRAVMGDEPRLVAALDELSHLLDGFVTAAAGTQELFEDPRRSELARRLRTASFSQIDELLDDLEIHMDELRDWTEWRMWRERAELEGWGAFVEGLVDADINADEVVPAFQRAYWNRRLESLFEEEPDLAEDLRGGAFQRWVDEFRKLDRQLVRTGAHRLIDSRESARRTLVSTRGSEVELLRKEARKVRRHLPVRVLLSRLPVLLSELKPCLMMSPLSVSHFLAPDHTFDLVVFDEASQVPPQDAINCIYRGTQVIVAGDSKQLPPTPFFQIAELDELRPEEEDQSTQEDMESVLDSCGALLPSHGLRWHYRSHSEQLIAFSNQNIYNGALVTFPSVEAGSDRVGVGFRYVPDGLYDRGGSATNRREAEVVAQRVLELLRDGSGRSVGVIAFNSAQAHAIGEELDLLRAENPDVEEYFRGDRLDGVFVKHLEAVQGDERDVILFSVGYGRDREGKFTMNFGPLNKEGGQRRLNVAVTRARERIEVISSVRATDFNLGDNASAGARLLRDYLRYAEAGGGPAPVATERPSEAEWPTRLEQEVGRVIADLGFEVIPRVGVGSFRIDIGVALPGQRDRLIMGVECDGEGYAGTPTARDRERLRHEVLASLGWGSIHRVWSLDWVRNRTGEIERLRQALDEARARHEEGVLEQATALPDDDRHPAPERVTRQVVEISSAASAVALPWTTTYKRADLGYHSSYYEFHETVNRVEQTEVLIALLAVEAPVSVEYATRRLAEAWCVGRVGHRVEAACRQAISQAERRKAAIVRDDFIWRPGQTLTSVRVPDPNDPSTRREIADICPEEIDLAIDNLRAADPALEDSQLVTLVARVLGFDRTGDRIRSAVLARLTARGGV